MACSHEVVTESFVDFLCVSLPGAVAPKLPARSVESGKIKSSFDDSPSSNAIERSFPSATRKDERFRMLVRERVQLKLQRYHRFPVQRHIGARTPSLQRRSSDSDAVPNFSIVRHVSNSQRQDRRDSQPGLEHGDKDCAISNDSRTSQRAQYAFSLVIGERSASTHAAKIRTPFFRDFGLTKVTGQTGPPPEKMQAAASECCDGLLFPPEQPPISQASCQLPSDVSVMKSPPSLRGNKTTKTLPRPCWRDPASYVFRVLDAVIGKRNRRISAELAG